MNPFRSRIARGAADPAAVAETPAFLAFVEAQPLVAGHVVIVAKRDEDHLFDLSAGELAELMTLAKRIAEALRAEFPCAKIGTAALGLVARQAHLHLVPIATADDLNFTRAKLSLPDERVAEIAAAIRARLAGDHSA